VFIKIVIVLLLFIVAASLLGQRGQTMTPTVPRRTKPALRTLMTRVALILLAIGAAVAIVHLSGCGRTGPAFFATDVSGAEFGRLTALGDFADPDGRRPTSADFSGKAVVVFFGYTQCPDICPTTLASMQQAMKLLGADAERVKVLFVTVDPERDTAEVLATYVPWFDPRFVGLRADPATTLAAAKEFRVYYSKVFPKDVEKMGEKGSAMGYSIDHTATSYAYDPQGRLRLAIRHGETSEHIAADLRLLLAGQ
jgi:protein SCO1/2